MTPTLRPLTRPAQRSPSSIEYRQRRAQAGLEFTGEVSA